MDQKIANEIRKALAILINQRIDWNAERCLKRSEIKPDKFSIPNAGGEGNVSANAIKVATNSDDSDGRLRGELKALLRYTEVYNSSTDYDGADEDLARIANLAERLMPDALEIVRTSVKKQNQSAMLALATNSRLLGINERGRTPLALSSFLFGDVAVIEALPDTAPQSFREWKALQSSAAQIRLQLRKLLLDTSGCFQATGDTAKAYGIDIVRLVEDYPADIATIEYADLSGLSTDLKQSLQSMKDAIVLGRLNKLLQDAKKIQSSTVNELGTDFDKQKVVSTFKELAGTLSDMGAWATNDIGISLKGFTDLCEAFRSSAVKECLSSLQGFEEIGDDEQSPVKKVVRGARLPLLPLLTIERFLNCAKKVVHAAEAHAQTLESQYKGVSPSEKAQELVSAFDDLVADLVTLQRGET